MKTVKINFLGEEYELGFVKGTYMNGNIYIGVCTMEGELWSDFTTNLGYELDEKQAFIDVNSPSAPEILKQLKKKKLVKDLYESMSSGYVVYPLYSLSDNFINNWCEELE